MTFGVWNHVAVAARSGAVEFYINGGFAGLGYGEQIKVRGGSGSNELVLGGLGAACPTCLPFGGYMDEIRLFGDMLPGHTIAAWKDFTMTPQHPSSEVLLAHFTFDKTNGTVVNRASPAIGFATQGGHAPSLVQDMDGFGVYFGGEIAVDGDTLVVGQDSLNYQNKLFVYRRETPGSPSSTWRLVQTIDGDDPAVKCGMSHTPPVGLYGPQWPGGKGLAVHGDVLVTTCQRTSNVAIDGGFAVIFTRDTLDSNWTLSHRVSIDDSTDTSKRIDSVAVHGETVVLGKTNEPNQVEGVAAANAGFAYVFARLAQNNWTRVQRLHAPDVFSVVDNGFFGSSVAIDGDQLVVGAYAQGDGHNGAVYLFARDTPGDVNSNWTQTQRISPDPDTGRASTKNTAGGDVYVNQLSKFFGWDVALQHDVLVVAAPGANRWGELAKVGPDGGAAFVYTRADANGTYFPFTTFCRLIAHTRTRRDYYLCPYKTP